MSIVTRRRGEGRIGAAIAWVSGALAVCAAVVLALMMYVIFADVVLRYFFGSPLTGSVEIIYCLMGLMVCLGLGITTYENGHVRVDVLTSILPPRARALCDVIAHVLAVIAAGLVTWRLAITAHDQFLDINVTQVLRLPVWIVAIVMAVCSVMLILALLLHLAAAVRALVDPAALES